MSSGLRKWHLFMLTEHLEMIFVDLDQTGVGQTLPLEISVIIKEVFPSLEPDVKHEFSNQMSISQLSMPKRNFKDRLDMMSAWCYFKQSCKFFTLSAESAFLFVFY